jgi:hypothetical protein
VVSSALAIGQVQPYRSASTVQALPQNLGDFPFLPYFGKIAAVHFLFFSDYFRVHFFSALMRQLILS